MTDIFKKDMSAKAADERIRLIMQEGITPRMMEMSPSDYVNISFSVATELMMQGLGTVAIMNEGMLDQYVNRLMDKVLDLKHIVRSEEFRREYIEGECECSVNDAACPADDEIGKK